MTTPYAEEPSSQSGAFPAAAFAGMGARMRALLKKLPTLPRWVIPVLLLLVALAMRAPLFGNALIYNDEDFYLYGGGQMWLGRWPYLDIWDRKPFGLFALFAFFHAFGPWRFWAYQLCATGCVWLTALLVRRMALLIASPGGAFVAAVFYIVALETRKGFGGQTPVFYNLLVACAFWLVVSRMETLQRQPARLRLTGLACMGLFGLALQLKPTVVFEGMFLGLVLLWLGWKGGQKPLALLLDGVLWVAAALLPTVLVVLGYVLAGHGREWWFANILSFFHRANAPEPHDVRQLLVIVGVFLLCGWVFTWAQKTRFSAAQKRAYLFLSAWALVALVAVWLVGGYFIHYALPLMLPLSILVAPVWQERTGKLLLIGVMVVLVLSGVRQVRHIAKKRGLETYREIVRTLSDPPGCVFEYLATPILMDATPQAARCQLTRWPFPAHLGLQREQGAMGVTPDEGTEVARIFAAHPRYVVINDFFQDPKDEGVPATDLAVIRHLLADYEPVYLHRRSQPVPGRVAQVPPAAAAALVAAMHTRLQGPLKEGKRADVDFSIWRLRPGLQADLPRPDLSSPALQ
ncbi:hypothetical protein [Oecophyllibacter saccharovorans]|uniref:hypothetical protein n=1 Tax=Oecophyllibacter saccharovorans TaxID=2558360 RepID=UPI00116BA64F|nr:hypothetical protein [Oecophyllibacter saccharovorans]TPW33688.1 hypothetical protein E3203_07705 [Oecophyllibacter saccharovorans]